MEAERAITCQRCGTCCCTHLYAYVTQEDRARWQEEGRSDILDLVDTNATVWAGDRIVACRDGHSLGMCPFLIRQGNFCSCAIYATRPKVCRDFGPGSSRLCPQWKEGG